MSKVVTHYWAKPIPDRRFDWSVVTSDYEPGAPIGYGRTEQEAITDLRIICCETCNGEGRELVTAAGEWDPEDRGPCPYCEATGGEIIRTQPIEMEDLDHA